MTLAISSYGALPQPQGNGLELDLSWALDERNYLAIDLDVLVAAQLADEGRDLRFIHSYLVRDPYGEGILGPAVAGVFGLTGRPCGVTCGAGVSGLLHALAALARGGQAYVVGDVYPDFPHWATTAGDVCSRQSADVAGHIDGVRASAAAVVLVERPTILDGASDLASLRELCEGVAASGAVVIVDESYGNYAPSSLSAAPLVADVRNLVVLRGLSKAYCLGSLRVGYAVSSPATTERIRRVIPPLATGSLSLRIARAVLERGDIAAPLRERVAAAREEVVGLLKGPGLVDPLPSWESVPYILCRGDAEEIHQRLAALGIATKRQPFWTGASGAIRHACRLSVPLSPERIATLRRLVG